MGLTPSSRLTTLVPASSTASVASRRWTSGTSRMTPSTRTSTATIPMANRTHAEIMEAGHANDRSYLYRYDRLNRLIFAESGKFTFDGDGQPDGFETPENAKPTAHTWSMDLLGNWSKPVGDYSFRRFQDDNGDGEFDPAEDVTLSGQLHNTNAANEIVSVVTEAGPTPFVYDAAGNLIDNGVRTFKYDAWNRVVEVKASTNLIAEYEYDALGRRIRKRVENSGAPLDTTGDGDYFYYDGHRVLEHRKTNASDTAVEPHRRYVYGLDYIDEVVAYYDTGAADPNPHFVLQDANYDVVAVTDHQGYLEQQYAYAPYGAYQHIEDGSGNAEGNGPADLTALLIPLGRNGLILDRETGLYYNRARYYDPLLSRFLQADPNGTGMVLGSGAPYNAVLFAVQPAAHVGAQYRDGMSLYHYVQSNPGRHTDVLGMKCGPWTNLGVSNGFQTVTIRGAYLREPRSTEQWVIRGLLRRTLAEETVTVRDVDFRILSTVKVGIKVTGVRADNGEAGRCPDDTRYEKCVLLADCSGDTTRLQQD